jgi:ElaB/YqjD/DUF883 family membrane-anchored ribosome-binding protein
MEPSTGDLKNAAASAGNYASEKARQTAQNVSERISDKMDKSQARIEDIYHAARDRAENYYDTSVDFVKKYPISTVAGAAAIGFVAGVLLRRTNKH